MSATYVGLNGARVFITGGATGIGAAMVTAFCDQGASVGFIDLDGDRGQGLAAETGAWFRQIDVTTADDLTESVRDFASESGGLDCLINNVANDMRHDFDTLSQADWRANLAVNLDPVFLASQAASPFLKASNIGSIINLSSLNILLGPGDLVAYTAAKSAIIGLTKSMARALGSGGVRVNAIVPGWVETERQKQLWMTNAARQAWLDQCALKAPLLPQHIANAALFLASDSAEMITGQSIIVDGGRT